MPARGLKCILRTLRRNTAFRDMYCRRILSVSHAGRILGVLEPVYLHQPLSRTRQSRCMTGLRKLVDGKDYFVVTTNVDHCFQKAGFEKKRLFYTQGDYGLFQCSGPCHFKTYDNEPIIRKMIAAQGYGEKADGTMALPEGSQAKMAVPAELLPHCPRCGRPMTMNLRADDTFVEDEGWHAAAERYESFLRTRAGQKVLFLELGVGYNTPGIIKYPFWRMTDRNPNATYACLNYGEVVCPREIEKRAICIDGDIGTCLLTPEEGGKA